MRRVLDRVVDEIGQHLAGALGVARHLRQHSGNRHGDRRVVAHPEACSRGHRPHELLGIEGLGDDPEGAAVELAGEQDLLHQVGEPLRLGADHVEQVLPGLGRQLVLPLEQRHCGAVQRGERRAQLVRDRGDELSAELLEPPLAGDVAERIHDAVGQGDAGDREPDLPPFDLQRHGLGARLVVDLAGPACHRNPGSYRRPARDDLRRAITDGVRA